MTRFKLGNAPCSWGTIEGTGTEAERIPYTQMLDELEASGYTGTELGDYGFYADGCEHFTARVGGQGSHHVGRICRRSLS